MRRKIMCALAFIALTLAATGGGLVYRYYHPPTYELCVPVRWKPENIPIQFAVRDVYHTFLRISMMESFHLDAKAFEEIGMDNDIFASVILSSKQKYKIGENGTHFPLIIVPHNNPENEAVLLWQNSHGINNAYFFKQDAESWHYSLTEHKRSFGTRIKIIRIDSHGTEIEMFL